MELSLASITSVYLAFLCLFPQIHALPAVLSAIPSDWIFKGCYLDSVADRSLQGASTSSSTMTNEACISFCASQGFNLAGTEFAAECYCDFVINVSQEP